MFPNPQDVLPLPHRPSAGHYRKLAKELVKASKSGAVRAWCLRWIERSDVVVEKFAERGKTLTGAQFVIARLHGFESWPKFVKHLESLAAGSPASRFEAAADAIVSGDVATLRRLLGEDPALIHVRSTREHGATLLHYVAANGVENFRQKTPQNIIEIAGLLLDAGADMEAAAKVYGGACTVLLLAATSAHPEREGVQQSLLEALVDRGARVGPAIIASCVGNGQPAAAEFFARRGALVGFAEAAALGHIDIAKSLFAEASQDARTKGFLYACGYGRDAVVAYLLEQGVNPAVQDRDGQTGLHWAAIGGHPHTVRLLLSHNASLEVENAFGGNAFGQALWSAAHGQKAEVSLAILEELVKGGAKIPLQHVPVSPKVDAWLAKCGSRAEPGWSWFGE